MAFHVADDEHTSEEGGVLSEINIIPLVDVMLVLLIIFMITVPMMKAGVDVSLPQGRHAEALQEERIIVYLDKQKRVFVETDPVHEAVLAERLREVAATNASVYLHADRSLAYGDVMEFMDALKGAGIETVALVMDEAPPAPSAKTGRKR